VGGGVSFTLQGYGSDHLGEINARERNIQWVGGRSSGEKGRRALSTRKEGTPGRHQCGEGEDAWIG